MPAAPAVAAVAIPRRAPAGMTLLEVLVSCAILAVGLASVAALLPAAGMRFGQAVQADRAGVLAANARADLVTRGLVAADVFSSSTTACAFGQVLTALNTISSTVRTWPTVVGNPSAVVGQRIDTGNPRGFQLEDDLVYVPASSAATPRNSFMITGSTGPRSFNAGICWGTTLTLTGGSAASGMPATLGIAVFRKAGEAQEFILTGTTTSATLRCAGVITTGTAAVTGELAIDGARRLLLPPCSAALALTNPPRWVRVTSSWTIPGPIVSGTENTALRRSFVVLDPNPMPATSGSVRVVGFDGLLRLDQHPVTLD